MASHRDITTPLAIVIAAGATLLGHLVFHLVTYGNDPQGFFALRFFGAPATLLALVLVPALVVLVRRVRGHRSETTIRRGRAFAWLFGALVILNALATVAFSGIDAMGYWLMAVIYFLPLAFLLSTIMGTVALFVALRMSRRASPPDAHR